MVDDHRSLDAGPMLREVIRLLRAHPVPLLAPLVLVALLTGGGAGGGDTTVDAGEGPPWQVIPFFALVGFLAFALLVLVFLVFVYAWLVTTRATLDAVGGRDPDLGRAASEVGPLYLGGALTALLWVVAVVAALFLLIVPGLIVLTALTPWAAVVVEERKTGGEALRRAGSLTRGHKAQLFLLVLLGIAISIGAGITLGWIPVLGGALASLVSGVVNAAVAVLGVVVYTRKVGGEAAAPPPQPV